MSLLRRKVRKHRFRTPSFSLRFRRTTEASASSGNCVTLLESGERFFEELIRRIREAREYVFAEFYIVRDDCAGCLFAEALLDAVRRGVSVSLLYDYVGCFDTGASYFRRLELGGVRLLCFNPPSLRRGLTWFDKRDHRKLVVIDGCTGFVGGLNIGDEYVGYCGVPSWRDLGLRIEGPAVGQLGRLFLDAWQQEQGASLFPADALPPPSRVGDAEVNLVSGGPHRLRPYIRSAYLMAIAGASESVTILNPYFIPGPRVLRSLLRAARRGVRVRLILPEKSDVPLIRLVSRSSYLPLLRGGVEIYERQGTILHAKLMAIDGCWSVIGSANLDYRSFHRNYELNLIVDSHAFGAQVEEMVAGDLAASRRITPESHESRGLLVRALEFLLAPFSRFL